MRLPVEIRADRELQLKVAGPDKNGLRGQGLKLISCSIYIARSPPPKAQPRLHKWGMLLTALQDCPIAVSADT